MRRTALFLLILLFLPGGSFAENRALLVGIGFYEVDGADLPGVDQDIKMMRQVALKLGFSDREIRILSHDEATLDGIVGSIDEWLIQGTTSSDRALLYHSGHGTLVADDSGDETDGNDEALLPYDFGAGDPRHDGASKPRRVLLDDELGELLRKIPAREVVVLVDSCHSGTMTRAIQRSHKFYPYEGMPENRSSSLMDKRVERYDSVILLSAAAPDQEAQTSSRGALFTQGIHRAVERSAPERRLTLEDLRRETEEYIREAVGTRTRLRHTPVFDGNPALQRLNFFLPDRRAAEAADELPGVDGATAPPPRPAPVARPPEPEDRLSGASLDLWTGLELLVRDAADVLAVRTDKSVYREGELLDISVTAPFDGYLHVLNVGDGEDEIVLLFPNAHQRNNRVRSGDTVRIPRPGVFRLRAHLPSGRTRQRNLVAVIHTTSPLNLYENPSTAEETFRVLRGSEVGSTLRSFRPEPAVDTPYTAGHVVVTIEN